MKMIQITDEKKDKLSKGLEKMLRIGGMLMSCVEGLEDEDYEGYGERDYDGYGERDYDEYDDRGMGMRMGRRGSSSNSGRYGMRRGR